jgi:hypothetical protein
LRDSDLAGSDGGSDRNQHIIIANLHITIAFTKQFRLRSSAI